MDTLKIRTIYFKHKEIIPKINWTMAGYSRAAYRTGFYIPDLDLCLDAGPPIVQYPKDIMITHTHGDHIASLPFTMIGDFGKKNFYNVYVPEEAEQHIEVYILSLFVANWMVPHTSIPTKDWYKIHAMKEGLKFRKEFNKQPIEVEIFKCYHRIPTVGYGLSLIKTKLKTEYYGFPGKKLAEMKKDGIDITEEIIIPQLVYLCDTTCKVFDNLEIFKYKVIMIECSFYEEPDLKHAKEKKHVHWLNLRRFVQSYPDCHFILFHFSQRHKDADIHQFFNQEMKTYNLKNLKIWLPPITDSELLGNRNSIP